MQGKGQGSGDAPVAFLTFVLPMIEAMKQKGFGAFLRAAISVTLLHILSIMYVDDADNFNTATNVNQPGEEVILATQESADTWHGLLRAGGGALAAEKSFWYMIDFEFVPSSCQWKFRRKDSLPGDITRRQHEEADSIPTRESGNVRSKHCQRHSHKKRSMAGHEYNHHEDPGLPNGSYHNPGEKMGLHHGSGPEFSSPQIGLRKQLREETSLWSHWP